MCVFVFIIDYFLWIYSSKCLNSKCVDLKILQHFRRNIKEKVYYKATFLW